MTTQRHKPAPSARTVTAAALAAALALPMLASAGSLAAYATTATGRGSTVSGVLALVILMIAGINLYGAAALLRGQRRYAQLGGYLTIAVTALILAGVTQGEAATTIGVVFLVPAIAMLTLLGARSPSRHVGRHRATPGMRRAAAVRRPA